MTPDLTPKRSDDPPEPGWRFRVGLAVKKYPVQVALLCAMVPVTFLGLFLLGAYEKIDAQQSAIVTAQGEIQANRKALTFQACTNNNAQTRGLNKLNDTLQALIESSPKQYETIRPVLEQAGIDVNALIKASRPVTEKNVADLEAARVTLLNCVQQVEQIENLSPPNRKTPVRGKIPPGKK